MSKSTYNTNEEEIAGSTIRDWPEDDRPREKLVNRGADNLTDAELLAILIRTGTRKATAVDIGKQLMQGHESLYRLSQKNVQQLINLAIPGLQKAKVVSLAAAFEIGKRIGARLKDEKKVQFSSPATVAERYIPLMSNLKQEVLKVLLLDSAKQLLREHNVTTGTLNSSLAHPREVFREAIIEPAASIILLHNHPSGNPDPSSDDMQITKQLIDAGKIIGIHVDDHIIIAGSTYTSFVERGLM